MSTTAFPRLDLAGVPVHPVSMDQTVDQVRRWILAEEHRVAVGVNAHVVNLAGADPAFRELLSRADLTYADGQAVVWACRWLGGQVAERVATTDLIHPLASMCAREGFAMYFFGSKPGVADRAAERLRAAQPMLRVDCHHGYVDPADTPALIADINASEAVVLLVGLGDPLQHEWLARHRDELRPYVLMTCGGLFDWVSGDNRRPPGWIVRIGLEWSWRLLLEPRRLAKRYLIGNPAFLARVIRARKQQGRR